MSEVPTNLIKLTILLCNKIKKKEEIGRCSRGNKKETWRTSCTTDLKMKGLLKILADCHLGVQVVQVIL